MVLTATFYEHAQDYERVNRLLVDAYPDEGPHTAWLQPRWEYAHFHPLIRGAPLDKMGMFMVGDLLVGVVNFEFTPAFVYLQVRPGHEEIIPTMMDFAEEYLGGYSASLGAEVLGIHVNDFDAALTAEVAARGFERRPDFTEGESTISLREPLPAGALPAGYRLMSLADENDLAKVDRVLWRGFGHAGPPPADGPADREFMQSAPNFRHDLTIVAVAPDGEYAAFGGMWHQPENQFGYVEPVATDPDHRRLGLGRAVVLESLRRVAALGAEIAWVGSDLEFYAAIGFEKRFETHVWVKERNGPR